MKTFKEYEYQRPSLEKVEAEFNRLLQEFTTAKSVAAQDEVMQQINALRNEFGSAALVSIRHAIDTTDPFYEAENDYFDEVSPAYEGLVFRYYQALVQSENRPQLEEKWGRQLFRIAETHLKTFAPEIIPDLQTENKLASQYTKLRASARIPLPGRKETWPRWAPSWKQRNKRCAGGPRSLYRLLPPMKAIRRDLRPIGEGPRQNCEKIRV